MLKHTHTQLEIYFTANTTPIDLTSHHNFTCSIPPWFINIETATYNEYGARIPGATLWRTIEEQAPPSDCASGYVVKSGQEYNRGQEGVA